MRGYSLLLATLLLAPLVRADTLTEADREALLERLQKIQDAADAKVDERFRIAVAAFRSAMQSDDAAVDLYVKCIEKVQFEDQNKKGQEFRDWKRDQAEHLQSVGFRRALRHQLRWLVLTLQVASSKQEASKFSSEARQIVDDIFSDIKSMEGQRSVLGQGVMSTVFARTYDLTAVKVADWPMSPVDLERLYDRVILPPYRFPEKADTLRSAWLKRIQQEGSMVEYLGGGGGNGNGNGRGNGNGGGRGGEKEAPRIGTKEALRPPEYQKFLEDTYPDLLWQMEEDAYKAGDQRGAALKMFQHLEKYVTHQKAPEWSKRFRALLEPPEKEAPAASPAKPEPVYPPGRTSTPAPIPEPEPVAPQTTGTTPVAPQGPVNPFGTPVPQ